MKKIFIFLMTVSINQVVFSQDTDSTKKHHLHPQLQDLLMCITGIILMIPSQEATNNYTSFTNSQNSFELGMASIKADHSFGKASATIDLGFGRRAEEFSYGNPGSPYFICS